jgi:hypothetical protein
MHVATRRGTADVARWDRPTCEDMRELDVARHAVVPHLRALCCGVCVCVCVCVRARVSLCVSTCVPV